MVWRLFGGELCVAHQVAIGQRILDPRGPLEFVPFLLFGKECDPVSPGIFGFIEGGIGHMDEVTLGEGIVGDRSGRCHSKTCGDVVVGLGVPEDEVVHRAAQFFGHTVGVFLGGVREDDREFFSPVSGQGVILADLFFEYGTEFLEDEVSYLMPIGVIKFLKEVDVDKEEGDFCLITNGSADLIVQAVLKIAVIVGGSQAVDIGKISEDLVFFLEFTSQVLQLDLGLDKFLIHLIEIEVDEAEPDVGLLEDLLDGFGVFDTHTKVLARHVHLGMEFTQDVLHVFIVEPEEVFGLLAESFVEFLGCGRVEDGNEEVGEVGGLASDLDLLDATGIFQGFVVVEDREKQDLRKTPVFGHLVTDSGVGGAEDFFLDNKSICFVAGHGGQDRFIFLGKGSSENEFTEVLEEPADEDFFGICPLDAFHNQF